MISNPENLARILATSAKAIETARDTKQSPRFRRHRDAFDFDSVTGTARADDPEQLAQRLFLQVAPDVEDALARQTRDRRPGTGPSPRCAVAARFNPLSSVRVGDRVGVAVYTTRLAFFDLDTGLAIWD